MLFMGIRFEKTVYSHFPKLWVDSQKADKQESTLILTLGKKYTGISTNVQLFLKLSLGMNNRFDWKINSVISLLKFCSPVTVNYMALTCPPL